MACVDAQRSHKAPNLELSAAAEKQGLSLLGWDVTCAPADPAWPRLPYAPEEPELRHYLFPGYYDDWATIKPVRQV